MFSTTILKFLISALAILSVSGAAIVQPHNMKRSELAARTNSARMAQGQPPLPPRSLTPTRASLVARTGNHHSHPSGSPHLPKKCIKITKKSNGAFLGYLSRFYVDGKGTYTVDSRDEKCLKVRVPGGQGPFDLEINNAGGDEKWLALATSIGSSYALPVKGAQSSNSVKDKNSNENETPWSQSTIWSKSGGNGLLASWRNGQGTLNFVKTYLRSGGPQRQLYFALNNDFDNFNDKTEVSLSLVDTNGPN